MIMLDFDGTLNHGPYTNRFECSGEPRPEDVRRVMEYLIAGREVVIFTARLADASPRHTREIAEAIQDWTAKHFDGWRPHVTAIKHPGVIVDNHAITYVDGLPSLEQIDALANGQPFMSAAAYDERRTA